MSQLKEFTEMPGPHGVPLLGSMPQLISHPETVLMSWGKEYYGNVFRYRMLTKQCIVLNGFEAIREGLVTNGDEMSGRITGEIFKATRDNRGLFFVDYGEFWKKWKAFTLKAVKSVMEDLPQTIENEARELSTDILQDAAETGKPVSLKQSLYLRLAQVVFKAFMNKEFKPKEKQNLEGIYAEIYAPFTSIQFPLLLFAPSLARFPPFSWFLTNLTNERKKIVKQLMEWMDDQQEENKPGSPPTSMISCFYQDDPSPSEDDKKTLALLLIDLVFAGTATVAQEIMWILLFLLKHPDKLEKVQQELDMENYSSPSELYSTCGKASYIKAVIQEGIRLRPIAPGSLFHVTKSNSQVGGYKIPKGVVVFPNLWSVHHDPEIWGPDTESFRPERHLDTEGNFIKSDRVIPFSIGSRRCAGEMIAKADIFIFLVVILERYDLALDKNFQDIDMNGLTSGILQTPEFEVTVAEKKTTKTANDSSTS